MEEEAETGRNGGTMKDELETRKNGGLKLWVLVVGMGGCRAGLLLGTHSWWSGRRVTAESLFGGSTGADQAHSQGRLSLGSGVSRA